MQARCTKDREHFTKTDRVRRARDGAACRVKNGQRAPHRGPLGVIMHPKTCGAP